MKDGKAQLESFFVDYVDDLKDRFKDVVSELGSPIEELLLASLLSEAICQGLFIQLQGRNDGIYLGDDGPDIIRIFPQYQIGKYRVDFYIEYWNINKLLKLLIVECDGHDFHEKTKQQAQSDKKRDRILQNIAPVYRYTGSEIFKEAHECSYQIVEFLTKRN